MALPPKDIDRMKECLTKLMKVRTTFKGKCSRLQKPRVPKSQYPFVQTVRVSLILIV